MENQEGVKQTSLELSVGDSSDYEVKEGPVRPRHLEELTKTQENISARKIGVNPEEEMAEVLVVE